MPSATRSIDAWSILDLVARRWFWLFAGAVLFGSLAFLAAQRFIGPKYTASARLLRYETPGTGDFFESANPSAETFAGLLTSPDLLRTVGQKADPPIPPETFVKQIKVGSTLDADSDLVTVALAARSRGQAVELLNAYLDEVVIFTREMQARQAAVLANTYLKKELERMDQDIVAIEDQFRGLAVPPAITNKLAQIGGHLTSMNRNLAQGQPSAFVRLETERLNTSLAELGVLLSKYTEIHPLVKQKESEVAALKSQLVNAASQTNRIGEMMMPDVLPLTAAGAGQGFNPQADIIRAKLMALEDGRVQLANRQHEAELYAKDPPGVVKVFAPATPSTVKESWRRTKKGLVTAFGALFGFGAALCLVALVEFGDSRLKTADDIRRVTKLPVLGSLPDLESMDPEARSEWAFRTWTMLQGRLSRSPNHGLVCGITSSQDGEGRSTWIRLLTEAASLTGFRVLTIATQHSSMNVGPGAENGQVCELTPEMLQLTAETANDCQALASSVLSAPDAIADQLTGPNSRPVVHIPLPGWVWNLERRKQWRDALNFWRRIDNLVIFVELPPANVTEAVLLGSSLPNLIWLASSGKPNAAKTRDQIETLHHARCNLAGAVLNRVSGPAFRRRFIRWFGCVAALLFLSMGPASGQSPAPALESGTNRNSVVDPVASDPAAADHFAGNTNRSFSILHPWQRAAWQEHLTLGPGDVLNLGLYGEPDLTIREVAIAPDGRISFLEAQDVQAAGLTIDEFRSRLDEELSKYRRGPRSIVTPVAFHSKKYFVLGKVVSKGAYTLDRSVTVLEAIARAKGFESGLVDRNVVDLADFSRSFIAREGRRVPLDLEKLFRSGDLAQNIAVEPGDYLYIAPSDIQEIYVLGEVRLPGTVIYTPQQTLVSAISTRGGFTDRAFKSRVLIIRGDLNHPERLVASVGDVLNGRTPDFRLQPRDIVFVSHRPFIRVEELADLAATAFIQSVIASFVNVHVINPIE